MRLAPSTRLDKKTAERMGEEPEGPRPWYPHEDEAPEGSGRGFKNTSGVRLGMGAVRCPDVWIRNLPLLRLFQTPSATHCARAPTEANADPYFLRVVSQAE